MPKTLTDILASYQAHQQSLPAKRSADDTATGLANQKAIEDLQAQQVAAAAALKAARAAEDQDLADSVAALQDAIARLATSPTAAAASASPAPAATGPAT